MPATQSDPRKPEATTRRTADSSVVPFKDAIVPCQASCSGSGLGGFVGGVR